MNKRILQVRKDNGKNQDEFASDLNLTKNFISLIETGKREPSDRTVKDICKKYNVNEIWLRTGEGEPYIPKTRDEYVAELTVDLLMEEEDSFKNRFISLLAQMSHEEWLLLEKMVDKLANKKE